MADAIIIPVCQMIFIQKLLNGGRRKSKTLEKGIDDKLFKEVQSLTLHGQSDRVAGERFILAEFVKVGSVPIGSIHTQFLENASQFCLLRSLLAHYLLHLHVHKLCMACGCNQSPTLSLSQSGV
mmetsp:Transcript_1235/g.4227  ORF Transcript_1235/g.4227 Transcript_1235/m.4227 type:complete len:124 (-) Transcript_1235:734-1105(-)